MNVEGQTYYYNLSIFRKCYLTPLIHRQQRNDYHHELVEHLADADEAMGEIFLDERKPSEEEVHAAIRRATLKRAFTPVMMGTALKNKASGINL